MKLYLPLAFFALVLVSCSSAYKTGQTPDDVYFSPERTREEYARVEKKEPRYNDQRRYESDEDYREDRYLRMKTAYRRYSVLDDFDCYCYTGSNYNRYYDYYRMNNWNYYGRWNTVNWNYNPFAYNPYNYNPYYYNPYYNKPYYNGYVAGNVRPPVYNKPRTGNLQAYSNDNNYNSNGYQKNNRSFGTGTTNNSENYRNSGSNAGGFLRNVFGGSNNNSSTTTPSSSSSGSSSGSRSSSSGSGSTSAPSRKF